jgi:PAS domain S-box-containing protein
MPLPGQENNVILESISDGVFTVDHQWRITSFNRAAEEITGIRRAEAIGKLCAEVFRASMCETACALRATLESGRPLVNRQAFIINAEGRRIPVSVSTAVLRDKDGAVIGGAETFRDLSEVEALRREIEGRYQSGDMVSHSPAMKRIFELLPAVAATDSTVLIRGETGTGKELLARAIHGQGPRSDGPFVAVNCGALPDQLLESELFGYRKGAFTGAGADKPGRFQLAAGGTLFLDEIGEISPAMQVRLLRVLQERTYEPLGATHSETSNARILAATNRDLAEMVRQGEFRQDLYYRVHVVEMELPPLRERTEDIPLLCSHFVQRFNRLQHRQVAGVSQEAYEVLLAHHWPGNIRELENVIERAFILCGEGQIQSRCLPAELSRDLVKQGVSQEGSRGIMAASRSDAECTVLQQVLEQHNGNASRAAAELGIHRATLYRKMKRYGLALKSRA